MSLILQGSTSGSVTLQEPAVAGTTVLDLPAVSGTLITTASSGQSIPKAALPTGSVLQVVSTTKTDVFSTSSTGSVDITGMSATITPTSASSRILVMVKMMVGNSGAQNTGFTFQLFRNSTQINLGDAAGSRTRGFSGSEEGISTNTFGQYQSYDYSTLFLDSPSSTSALTYKITVSLTNTNTFYINSTGADTDTNTYPRGTSNIILMEIAA
jgi:hypothetical protein